MSFKALLNRLSPELVLLTKQKRIRRRSSLENVAEFSAAVSLFPSLCFAASAVKQFLNSFHFLSSKASKTPFVQIHKKGLEKVILMGKADLGLQDTRQRLISPLEKITTLFFLSPVVSRDIDTACVAVTHTLTVCPLSTCSLPLR